MCRVLNPECLVLSAARLALGTKCLVDYSAAETLRSIFTVSVGVLYASSLTTDSRRSTALPFDRIISVGAGLERPCFGFVRYASLSYLDLGDGDLAEDGGPLLGSVEGSFSSNWAVALDFQLRKRF